MKRVMGIIRGYTVEARPSLKVRAPLEILNTTEHSFVIDQTTVRWCLREVQGENHQMLEVPNAPEDVLPQTRSQISLIASWRTG